MTLKDNYKTMKIVKFASVVLIAFSLVTLFMSTSVLFDLFGIREREGNYVPFIVATNFLAGVFYLVGAYGLYTAKAWTARLLTIITVVLVGSFLGLLLHINSGGAYEAQTVKAMVFRISLTAIFAVLAWRYISKKNK